MSRPGVLAVCLTLLTALPASAWPAGPTDFYGDPLPDGAVARLGTTRFRVFGHDLTAALSADGNVVAVPLRQGGIVMLDAVTGKELSRVHLEAADDVLARCDVLALSPDGSTLAYP